MILWLEWFRRVYELRSACSRTTTFLWMTLALAGFSIRSSLQGGVSPFVSDLALKASAHKALRHFFHSPALRLDLLLACWVRMAMAFFPMVLAPGNRPIFVGDGIKIPKEGRKMPAVKSLHQESADNSKPAFIMGHSFQCLSLLVHGCAEQCLAVPLVSRIHEGVVFSNRTKKTLLDRFAAMFLEVTTIASRGAILLVDAYYASRKIILPLLAQGHHLVTKAKTTCVAYRPADKPTTVRPGRPRFYGAKVSVRDFFKDKSQFMEVASPVYGEHNVMLLIRSLDLLWRPVGCLVRFVLVIHPTRGRMILLCTDLTLAPLVVLWLYGLRFKIEVSFKQALWTVGVYAYRFWMMDMTPIRKGSGNQYLHRASDDYRKAVRRKLGAYHRFVALGCVAHGLLQYLATMYHAKVWSSFRGWLCTMNPKLVPSEQVTASALRSSLGEFLLSTDEGHDFKKFITDKSDPLRMQEVSMAA